MRAVSSRNLEPGSVRVTVDIHLPTDTQREAGEVYGAYLKEIADRLGEIVEKVVDTYPSAVPPAPLVPPASSLANIGDQEKTAQLAAQAVIGPAYVLSMAGQLDDTEALMSCVRQWNRPKVAHLFGGVVS